MDNKADMVESDESEYWDGEEVGDFEEIYMAQQDIIIPNINNIQTSNNSPAIQSYYDEESVLNNFSLSNMVGGCDDAGGSSNSRCPLDLRLSRTPFFLNLLQMSISKAEVEKVKAANIPTISIEIGNWQIFSEREGHLSAKIYYAKCKLIWEVLEGPLKYKIEMQWSDISAIRATTLENVPGILEVELNKPPLFFEEDSPQPGKHTEWKEASDFTSGQASFWRKHIVRLRPGILDKHYAKLLQCDQRLFDLSQMPFPTEETTFSDEPFSNIARNFISS